MRSTWLGFFKDESEHFFYSEDEIKKFLAQFEKKKSDNEDEPEEPVGPPEYEAIEIFEAGEFVKVEKVLEKFGFGFEDFLENDEDRFELQLGKKTATVKSLAAALARVKEHGKEGMYIQRYKGLGEMNPNQLWDTTMNPETRTVLQVRLDDVVEADEMFTVLMGDQVESRRRFILQNARTVRNLDI